MGFKAHFLEKTKHLLEIKASQVVFQKPRLYFFVKFLLIASIILQRMLMFLDNDQLYPFTFLIYHLTGLLLLFLLETILYHLMLKKKGLQKLSHAIFCVFQVILMELLMEISRSRRSHENFALLSLLQQEMLFICVLAVIFMHSSFNKGILLIYTSINFLLRLSPELNGVFYASWAVMTFMLTLSCLLMPLANDVHSNQTGTNEEFAKLENKPHGIAIVTKSKEIIFMNGVFKGTMNKPDENEAWRKLLKMRRFETYPEAAQQTVLQQIKSRPDFDPNIMLQKTEEECPKLMTYRTLGTLRRRETNTKPIITIKRPSGHNGGLLKRAQCFNPDITTGISSPGLTERAKLISNDKNYSNANDTQDMASTQRNYTKDVSSLKLEMETEDPLSVGFVLNNYIASISSNNLHSKYKNQPLEIVKITSDAPLIGELHDKNETYFQQIQGKKIQRIQAFEKNDEGRVCIYEITITPILRNKKEELLVSLRNVTYEMKVNDLDETNQYKDRLLKFVSHEFRTPLNCTIISLNMLRSLISRDLVKNYLSPALHSSQMLLCLVNDILDYSQMQARKLKVAICSCDIKVVFNEVVAMMEMQAAARKIQLKLEWDSRISRVYYTDGNRLKQILLNLISNALKFTLEGSITIKSTYIDPSVCKIEVADTGVGISEENLEVLFSEFGKIQENSHLNPQGVGLGLVISKLLSQELGPDRVGLRVKSEVDVGTTFYFLLSSKSEILEGDFEHTDYESSDEDQIGPQAFMPILKEVNMKKQLSVNSLNKPESVTKRTTFFPKAKTSGPKKAKGDNPYTFNFMHIYSKKTFSEMNTLITKTGYSTQKKNMHPYGSRKPSDKTVNTLGRKRCLSTGTLVNSEENDYSEEVVHVFKRLHKTCKCPKILLVDDNAFNLNALKLMLLGFGIESVGVIDGELAIQEVLDNEGHHYSCRNFSIIFMDIEMPRMDGFETAKALRKMMLNKEISYIPIIGISGHNPQEKRVECLLSGMNDMVEKPVTPQIIQDLIRKWVTPL